MDDGTYVSMEMPRYRCHKEVWALQFSHAQINTEGYLELSIMDEGFADLVMDEAFTMKHWDAIEKAGFEGYLVQYKDGYKSFSPKEPFEDGYTRL